jgi:hypothetical protein
MKNRQCFPKSLLLRWEEYPHGGVRSAAVAGELISLLCSLPKLKKLNIGICSQYMESVLQGIEEAQLKLPQVYILHMDRFSDTFLDMCPNVKTLSTRRLVRDKFQRVLNARNESVSKIENLILDGRYYVDCSFLDGWLCLTINREQIRVILTFNHRCCDSNATTENSAYRHGCS